MAVPTGNGTENITSSKLEDIADSTQSLIVGVQHHVYTVLSIIVHGIAVASGTGDRTLQVYVTGYDNHETPASNQPFYLFKWEVGVAETFVFNDKFTFMGYEPSSNTQAAVLAQAGSVAQTVKAYTDSADTKVDIITTFIDQDWSGSN